MPLEPIDIKIAILRRGDTLAKLARKWHTTPEVLSRVIHRRPPYLYPKIQEKLARYLDVAVADVGRDPSPRRAKSSEIDTQAA